MSYRFSNNLLLSGLADENESVRDAALSAGHVFVEHYATTYVLLFELILIFCCSLLIYGFLSLLNRSLPLLLPAIEDGIFSDNWRIRQSSVELLGDLLFKVDMSFM